MCFFPRLELEVEPIFASMALYDAKERKKVNAKAWNLGLKEKNCTICQEKVCLCLCIGKHPVFS